MSTILLDKHAGTESYLLPSIEGFYSGFEHILATKHNIIRVPNRALWSEASIENWLFQHALDAELLVGGDFRIINSLRELGWKGKVFYIALGELPYGATTLRNALPYLYKTDIIWFVSKSDKLIYDLLIEQNGGEAKAVVIPCGIDSEKYTQVSQVERKRLRRAWGFTPEDFVVLFTGRFTLEKNFHSILEVIFHLLNLGIRVKLLVAGKVDDLPFRQFNMWRDDLSVVIPKMVEKLKLSEHVKFLPWLDQEKINELYNVGDVYINLTLGQGEYFGYAPIEAMSTGLPVVGTAWGGFKDSIVDSKTGFLADTWISTNGIRFDMPKIIKALMFLKEAPHIRKELNSLAIQHVREHYSWNVYSNNILEAIDTVLRQDVEKSKTQLTEWGKSFHDRFSIVNQLTKKHTSISPLYTGLSDPHYLSIAEPYTSRGWLNSKSGNDLFVALAGHIKNNFFYSDDVLWPIRIPLNDTESQIMNLLSRHKTVDRSVFDCPDEVFDSLIKRGLIGVSYWNSIPNNKRP